jgi:methylenetetrahydrofolate dehydrogenase (NADP+)/methenyltetrahydrofolate cyclohydrolase
MALLDAYQVPLEGKTAVVVGRSVIVGKPVAQLLLARNATVVCTHSKTADLPGVCRQADVLVAAVGRAGLITADYVREGAVVVDVGINSVEDEAEIVRIAGGNSPQHRTLLKKGRALAGDVEWRTVVERAGAVSPVPGGVGPLTIALLMRNTLRACRRALGVD